MSRNRLLAYISSCIGYLSCGFLSGGKDLETNLCFFFNFERDTKLITIIKKKKKKISEHFIENKVTLRNSFLSNKFLDESLQVGRVDIGTYRTFIR